MEKIREILEEIRPDIDLDSDAKLVTDGVLDSVDIISLVAELSDEFDIKIKPAHLIPENFDSLDAIWNLVQELEEE